LRITNAVFLADSDEMVRLEAARILACIKPVPDRVKELLKEASNDSSFLVREEVLNGLFQPVYKQSHCAKNIGTAT
jgi:hypothetical protein